MGVFREEISLIKSIRVIHHIDTLSEKSKVITSVGYKKHFIKLSVYS